MFVGLNLLVELTYYRVLVANLLSNLAYRFASQSSPLTHTYSTCWLCIQTHPLWHACTRTRLYTQTLIHAHALSVKARERGKCTTLRLSAEKVAVVEALQKI